MIRAAGVQKVAVLVQPVKAVMKKLPERICAAIVTRGMGMPVVAANVKNVVIAGKK